MKYPVIIRDYDGDKLVRWSNVKISFGELEKLGSMGYVITKCVNKFIAEREINRQLTR